jgi:ribosomal protein L37AE/L43A
MERIGKPVIYDSKKGYVPDRQALARKGEAEAVIYICPECGDSLDISKGRVQVRECHKCKQTWPLSYAKAHFETTAEAESLDRGEPTLVTGTKGDC